MQYLVSITRILPLTIHFSLYNPHDSDGPVYIPRLLGPLGYFVSLEITDEDNKVVYHSEKPKAKLKLHPSRSTSYQALEPGYTYGIVFEVEDFRPTPGRYEISIAYSNQEFRGFPGNELGQMTYLTKLSFNAG